MDQEKSLPDWQAMYRDLREQLSSSVDALIVLHERVFTFRARLVHLVDQGEGLTHDQLVEFYNEIERLFPRRVRKTSKSLDV